MRALRLDQQILEAGADQSRDRRSRSRRRRRPACGYARPRPHRHLALAGCRAPRASRPAPRDGAGPRPCRRARAAAGSAPAPPRATRHQAAEQAGDDIVPGRRIGRDPLALDREGEQGLDRQRLGQQALTAAAAATAEAAEPPMPALIGTPLSMSSRTPKSAPRRRRARPAPPSSAVFAWTSDGSDCTSPVTSPSRTPGLASRNAVTRSCAAPKARPSTSKPTPTLPMLAGARALRIPLASWSCRSAYGCGRGQRRAAEQRPLQIHHVGEDRRRRTASGRRLCRAPRADRRRGR